MNRIDRRELQALALLGICLAILALTIAYAVMSEKLSISGTARMEASTWDIHYDNLYATTVGSSSYTLPAFSNTILTDYSVSLKQLGDSVTFQFRIVNNGSVSAKISSIVKSIPRCSGNNTIDTENVCNNLIYKIEYLDGSELKEGDILAAKSYKEVKLTVGYPSTNTYLPTDSVSIDNLDLDLLFVEN